MTNREFALKNQPFREACAKVRLPATKRQASKWRNHQGKAWKEGK